MDQQSHLGQISMSVFVSPANIGREGKCFIYVCFVRSGSRLMDSGVCLISLPRLAASRLLLVDLCLLSDGVWSGRERSLCLLSQTSLVSSRKRQNAQGFLLVVNPVHSTLHSVGYIF